MNPENKTELTEKMADCCFEISKIIFLIQTNINKMMKNENIDWGHLGSLNHVKENLQETLEFLKGK